MDETAFSELLTAVTPYIVKHDTVMRPAISPKERLTAMLRFLATGRQLEDLKFSTGISPQSLGKTHTRNVLSDISRTERAVFKGNAYFVLGFFCVLNRVGLEGLCHQQCT